MPQDHVINVPRAKKSQSEDPFYELGTTKEDIEGRIEEYEARLQALE